MSSWSERTICPKCNCVDSFCAFGSNRPYDTVGGYCLECGWGYDTIETQLTLDELNGYRTDENMPELVELPKT